MVCSYEPATMEEKSPEVIFETSFNSTILSYGAVCKEKPEERKSLRSRFGVPGFIREMKLILILAFPTMFTHLSVSIVVPIAMMFCGHLGREQLDGVALANSILNVCGISLCCGMSTACDTLFSQAYGGKNKHLVGMYLQRSLFLNVLLCFFCWSIYLNTESILLLLGQNPVVARIAGEYSLYCMPGLLFYIIYQVFVKYLQNQNRVLPPVIFGFIGNAFNVVAHYVAIYVLDYGYRGSAVVQALTYVVMAGLTVLYAIASGLYKHTWNGWSWGALEDWAGYLKIGLAGLVMIGVEWWSYEVGLIMSGLLGEVALGATTIAFQLQSISYVIPNGISVASSIRVGQNLGAGSAQGAKRAAFVAQIVAWLVFLVAGTVILAVKDVIPLLFTNDQDIIDQASEQIPAIVLIMFFNSITATSAGTFRGCGRQVIGAFCNCLGYIILSIPVSITLMFVAHVGAVGFWFGLAIGITPVAVAFLVFVARTDWEKQVETTEKLHSLKEGPVHPPSSNDKTPLLLGKDDDPAVPACVAMTTPTQYKSSTPRSMAKKRQLVLKSSLSTLFTICIFMTGVLVRVYVPVADPGHSLYAMDTNGTTVRTNLTT